MKKLSKIIALILLASLSVNTGWAMQAEAVTGPRALNNGAIHPLRSDRSGALANTEAHGRFQEMVLQGNTYTVSTAAAGVVLASTNLSPLNSSTGTPIVGVFNPLNSGKNLVITEACVGVSSNTAAGISPGAFYYNVNTGQSISQAGTVPINNLTGLQRGSVAVGLVNQALTGGTGTVLALKPVGNAQTLIQNTTAVTGQYATTIGCEDVSGKIIVPPGGMLGLANGISNTVTTVNGSLTWEEIPQ